MLLSDRREIVGLIFISIEQLHFTAAEGSYLKDMTAFLSENLFHFHFELLYKLKGNKGLDSACKAAALQALSLSLIHI